MFPIAGQTAGPNGLNFFEGTHGVMHGADSTPKVLTILTHDATHKKQC